MTHDIVLITFLTLMELIVLEIQFYKLKKEVELLEAFIRQHSATLIKHGSQIITVTSMVRTTL